MNERSECVRLIQVESGPELEEIRSLFLESAQSLDFNLCFKNFDKSRARKFQFSAFSFARATSDGIGNGSS
jgi:hypothetical protein